MINNELVAVIQKNAKATLNRIIELQLDLDSEVHKSLTALDVGTNDRMETLETSVK